MPRALCSSPGCQPGASASISSQNSEALLKEAFRSSVLPHRDFRTQGELATPEINSGAPQQQFPNSSALAARRGKQIKCNEQKSLAITAYVWVLNKSQVEFLPKELYSVPPRWPFFHVYPVPPHSSMKCWIFDAFQKLLINLLGVGGTVVSLEGCAWNCRSSYSSIQSGGQKTAPFPLYTGITAHCVWVDNLDLSPSKTTGGLCHIDMPVGKPRPTLNLSSGSAFLKSALTVSWDSSWEHTVKMYGLRIKSWVEKSQEEWMDRTMLKIHIRILNRLSFLHFWNSNAIQKANLSGTGRINLNVLDHSSDRRCWKINFQFVAGFLADSFTCYLGAKYFTFDNSKAEQSVRASCFGFCSRYPVHFQTKWRGEERKCGKDNVLEISIIAFVWTTSHGLVVVQYTEQSPRPSHN